MPHRVTRLAIQQAIINQDTTHLARNATPDTSVAFQQAINPGYKCHTGTLA